MMLSQQLVEYNNRRLDPESVFVGFLGTGEVFRNPDQVPTVTASPG